MTEEITQAAAKVWRASIDAASESGIAFRPAANRRGEAVIAAALAQARQAALEEGMHKATYELVDAEGSGEETDAAYNRGVMAAIAAIHTLSTPEPTKGE